MGFTADYPPTRLKQAYGDVVCSVLNQLCNVALASQRFQFDKPRHTVEQNEEEYRTLFYFSLWLSFATKHSLNQATDQGIEEDSDAEAEVMIEQDDDTDDETYGGVQGRQSEKELY